MNKLTSLTMKALLCAIALLCLTHPIFAQHVYSIRADTVRIYNDCDTAELVLENRTKDTLGFLYNKGNGRTEFRKLKLISVNNNAAIAIEGQDTLPLQMGAAGAKANATRVVAVYPGQNQISFGDSYTAGLGASSPEKRYANVIANTLGITLINRGQSGLGIWRANKEAYQYASAWDNNALLTIMAGYNDLRKNGGGPKTMKKIEVGYRSFLANAFLDTAVAGNSSAVIRTGTWDTISTDYGHKSKFLGAGLAAIQLSTAGATAKWTFGGTSLVVGLIGSNGTTNNSFDSARIQIDGVDYGWYQTNNTYDAENNGGPLAIVIRNLAVAAHTVTLTKGSGAGKLLLDYFGKLKGPGQTSSVIVSGIPAMLDSNYRYCKRVYGVDINDATVTAANDIIRNVVKEFQGFNVGYVDVNDYFDINSDIGADSIHPTNNGHLHLANALLSAAESQTASRFIQNQYDGPQDGGLWVTDSVRATLGRFLNGVYVGSESITGLKGTATQATLQAGGFDKIRVSNGVTGFVDMIGPVRNLYSTAFRIDTTTNTNTTLSGLQTTLLVNNQFTQDTVALPAVADAWLSNPSSGRIYTIKKIGKSTWPVIILSSPSAPTDSIEGKRRDTLFNYGDVLTVQAHNGQWRVLNRYSPSKDNNREQSVKSITGSATLTEKDHTVIVQNTGTATISLPDANTSQGYVYVLKKLSAAGNSITIDPLGAQLIDGVATKSFDIQNASVTIQANQGAWYITNAYMSPL